MARHAPRSRPRYQARPVRSESWCARSQKVGRGRRIAPENESAAVIPQQPEDVTPAENARRAPPFPGDALPETFGRSKKPLSFLEIGGDLLLELGHREGAAQSLAVDE